MFLDAGLDHLHDPTPKDTDDDCPPDPTRPQESSTAEIDIAAIPGELEVLLEPTADGTETTYTANGAVQREPGGTDPRRRRHRAVDVRSRDRDLVPSQVHLDADDVPHRIEVTQTTEETTVVVPADDPVGSIGRAQIGLSSAAPVLLDDEGSYVHTYADPTRSSVAAQVFGLKGSPSPPARTPPGA